MSMSAEQVRTGSMGIHTCGFGSSLLIQITIASCAWYSLASAVRSSLAFSNLG